MMTESAFNAAVDDLLADTEARVEEAADDIDFDVVSGILTLTFENASKIIINRQAAALQVWVAAKSGGYHLSFVDGDWVTDDGNAVEYYALLNRLCSEQANRTVTLNPV